jgi:hypothetical protein
VVYLIVHFFVLQGQRSQLGRQSEGDMDVGRGAKCATVGLDGTMSATGAFIDVAAEYSGATAHDGERDLDMGPVTYGKKATQTSPS